MAKKDDAQVKSKQIDQSMIAALARHVIDPPEDRLSEVSYLPIGAIKSLVMLQTYEGYIETIFEQIQKRRLWFFMRELRRNPNLTEDERKQKYEAVKLEMETADPVVRNLFIHQFRISYYQHTRGKEGQLMDKVTVLADTEMQTRNQEVEQGFTMPGKMQ